MPADSRALLALEMVRGSATVIGAVLVAVPVAAPVVVMIVVSPRLGSMLMWGCPRRLRAEAVAHPPSATFVNRTAVNDATRCGATSSRALVSMPGAFCVAEQAASPDSGQTLKQD